MHVHKDKGIFEILLIKLIKTRGTLRGFVCSYDNNDAGNGVGYAEMGSKSFLSCILTKNVLRKWYCLLKKKQVDLNDS